MCNSFVVDVAFVKYKTVALQILILKFDPSIVDQTDCIIYSITLLFGYDVYKKSLCYLAHGKLMQHADTKGVHLEIGVHFKQRTFSIHKISNKFRRYLKEHQDHFLFFLTIFSTISTSHKPSRIIPFYENSVHFTHIFSKLLEGTITIMW